MNVVYMILNRLNNKAYIGVTTQDNPEHRAYEHMCRFKRGDRDHKLYQAMRKHGPGNFTFYQLCCVLDKADLPFWEMVFIEVYNTYRNGYNSTPGGDVVSAETRKKISDKMRGRKITWYDKVLESRMSNPNRKDPKDYVAKGACNPNSSSYKVRFPDGHIETFRGLRAFCRQHGLSYNLLLAVLKGQQTHHKGFVLLERFNDQSESSYTQASGSGAHPIFMHTEMCGRGEDMVWPA